MTRYRSRLLVGLAIAIVAFLGVTLFRRNVNMPSGPPTSEWRTRLWNLQERETRAREAQQWSRSESLLQQILTLLPSDPSAHYARCDALIRLERPDEALDELQKAVELGWADLGAVKTDSAFADLRKHDAFAGILALASRIADQEMAIHVPSSLPTESASPLVVAFHGLGENLRRHLRYWQQAADQARVVVVAPCGVKRMPDRRVMAFRWDMASDLERGSGLPAWRATLLKYIAFAKQHVPIDDDRILVAGYSQGGFVAMKLLADDAVPLRGAILQATSYSTRALEAWAGRTVPPRIRTVVLVHEFDQLRPLGEEAYADLVKFGVESRRVFVTGADHEIPLDNPVRQIEALEFVLAGGSQGSKVPDLNDGT